MEESAAETGEDEEVERKEPTGAAAGTPPTEPPPSPPPSEGGGFDDASNVSVRGSDLISTLSGASVEETAAAPRPASRPSSWASEGAAAASEDEGSETDYTAPSPGRAREHAAAPPTREQPPVPTAEQLRASPFVDLDHPVTFYEGLKLLLMAPVVLVKVGGRGPSAAPAQAAQCRSGCPAAAAATAAAAGCAQLPFMLPPPLTITVPAAAAAGCGGAVRLGGAVAAAAGSQAANADAPLQARAGAGAAARGTAASRRAALVRPRSRTCPSTRARPAGSCWSASGSINGGASSSS